MGKLLGVLGEWGRWPQRIFQETHRGNPGAARSGSVPSSYIQAANPSRDKALTRNGESPLPQMLAGMKILREANAKCVAIPCNTAHFGNERAAACPCAYRRRGM
jgi:aspartate/glutamate racemase